MITGNPFKTEAEQQVTLGLEVRHVVPFLGVLTLVYCETTVDLRPGHIVEDVAAEDILSSSVGTVTANKTADVDNTLEDTGEFANDVNSW